MRHGKAITFALFLTAASVGLSGCLSNQYTRVDPNAVKNVGWVTEKHDLAKDHVKKCYSDTLAAPIPGGGVIFVPTGGGWCVTYPTEYTVQFKDDRQFEVLSMYGGFEVGECVAVYISKIEIPKIAREFQCGKKPKNQS